MSTRLLSARAKIKVIATSGVPADAIKAARLQRYWQSCLDSDPGLRRSLEEAWAEAERVVLGRLLYGDENVVTLGVKKRRRD